MKLLQELFYDESELITEFVDDGTGNKTKQHYIVGPYIMMEELNRNRRVYPEKVTVPAVEHYIENFVNQNRALGELNHSDEPGVDLTKAACLITELNRSGMTYDGKAMLIPGVPNGRIAIGLHESGVKLGVSTKGGGNVAKGKWNGKECNIVKSFRLTGVDIVHDPSAHIAMVNHIMENTEWVWKEATQSWEAAELIETIQKTVHKDIRTLNEDQAAIWFKAFTEALAKAPSKEKFLKHYEKNMTATAAAAALSTPERKVTREEVKAAWASLSRDPKYQNRIYRQSK